MPGPSDLRSLLAELSRPARGGQDAPRRAEVCRRALALVSREQQPEQWAALQSELSSSLAQNRLGNRADNLEQAIHSLQQALEVYTHAAFPADWAMTQHNLAAAYLDRILGERADNLEAAIEHCQQALEVRTRTTFPQRWATTQHTLGNVYFHRIRGERADNLEQAIHHYQQALEVRTRAALPADWAMTQNNLGNAYSNRILGDRADNLEQALHFLQQALEVRTRAAFPGQWANTQNNLASIYSDRMRGQRAENLEQAIHHYHQALEVYTHAAFPADWAMTQHNLAIAYWDRIRGERADNLEQSIGHCQQALEVRTRIAFPEQWAATQNTLANAYGDRIRGERADNLEQAILHYQQALEVHTRAAFPADWAMTQNNLANACSNRIRGERADNLELAIHHYQQALEVYTRTAYSERWAGTQNNLADAYRNRIRGERADNLEQAIHRFKQALEVHTRADYPDQWALMHNNLAIAYFDRIRGERADNLEQAIHQYEQALEVRTRTALPEQWATTQNNLGEAYRSRIRGERGDNLEQAIHHFQQALEVYTRAAYPDQWAAVQNNLALAYFDRTPFLAVGEQANNLEQAIHHYQQVLEVYTRPALPRQWATTQNNLANAYVGRTPFLAVGERADNLEQAIHHFQQALEVRTRAAFPAEHRGTQGDLGNLLFGEQRWPLALTALQGAIAAGDDLLALAHSETGRRFEVGETTQIFAQAAYCLLKTNQFGEALVMLERGKTRLLSESLALADVDLKSLPEHHRLPLQAGRQAVRDLEAEIRLPPDTPSRRTDRELADLLRDQRAELRACIDAIRQDNPDFMPLGLDLRGILKLIPPVGALVAPLITSQGSAAFVVLHGATAVTEAQVVLLDKFKPEDLNSLLRGTAEEPGWLWAYGAYYETHHLSSWQSAIVSVAQSLWNALLAPIHQRLESLRVKRLLLMPSAGLQMLPLHAAWRMVDGQIRTLLDDYEIAYAPSAQALDIARRRAGDRSDETALVVGINEYQTLGRLHNAVPEAEAVARILNTRPLLNGDATEQAVASGAAGAAYIHLSCHGSFDWANPLDSALYLTGDEPLKLSEIITALDLSSARLVTLSACETGISDVRQSPDEYLGLPAAFLQAGAPAVVSSLWTVDDRSTAILMERFYRNHREKGMAFPAALREAQLWLRNATRQELGDYYKTFIRMSPQEAFEALVDVGGGGQPGDKPYANPFYWAAFSFSGA